MVVIGNSNLCRSSILVPTSLPHGLLSKQAVFNIPSSICRPNEAASDPTVRKIVVEQTKQWTEMMEKHRKEEWELMKAHLHAQEEILKKLMETSQQNQMKQLEAKHERFVKDIQLRMHPIFLKLCILDLNFDVF